MESPRLDTKIRAALGWLHVVAPGIRVRKTELNWQEEKDPNSSWEEVRWMKWDEQIGFEPHNQKAV